MTSKLEKPHQEQQLQQRIDRLFAHHRESLGRLSAAELRAAASQFGGGGGDGGGGNGGAAAKRLCVWTVRVALCLLTAAVATATLSRELVVGGYATQSTEWLAALDLSGQKFLRRVSHTLRLYDAEPVRGMGHCLLANPISRVAPLCCGCRPPPRVARVRVTSGNLTAVADLVDSLYSRVVSPFLLTGPPAELRVDFARMAAFVAEHRAEFERGANTVRTLAAGPRAAVRRFADLFPAGSAASEPPPDQLLMWSFDHLTAVRALRRLVPRPAYFGQRTERLLRTSLLIAGRRHRRLPGGGDGDGGDGGDGGEFHTVGDFSGMLALAYAVPLTGRLTLRLAAKAACCGASGEPPTPPTPPGSSAPSAGSVTLEPGRVLFFPTDCYELQIRQTLDSPALVYIGFLYNGAHQAKRKRN